MAINSRYPTAIHIVTLLAQQMPERVTSEIIADSVNTNPVVVRRLLTQLSHQGIVRPQKGPGGGWDLGREASKISLGDLFRATNTHLEITTPRRDPNPLCRVGRSVHQVVARYFDEAAASFEASLNTTSVADVLAEIGQHA